MEEFEAELRGRIAMLETLLAVTIARLAGQTGNPAETIRGIMANAEDALLAAQHAASDADKRGADYALAAFDHVSDAMQKHLTGIAIPAGRG